MKIVRARKINDVDVSYIENNSSYGHDAFLMENAGQAHVIEHFLARMLLERKNTAMP
jgi:homoserine O-acetyltransferase